MQIQLSSEITEPYSTTSVISSYNRHLRDLEENYFFKTRNTLRTTCMPTREKNN